MRYNLYKQAKCLGFLVMLSLMSWTRSTEVVITSDIKNELIHQLWYNDSIGVLIDTQGISIGTCGPSTTKTGYESWLMVYQGNEVRSRLISDLYHTKTGFFLDTPRTFDGAMKQIQNVLDLLVGTTKQDLLTLVPLKTIDSTCQTTPASAPAIASSSSSQAPQVVPAVVYSTMRTPMLPEIAKSSMDLARPPRLSRADLDPAVRAIKNHYSSQDIFGQLGKDLPELTPQSRDLIEAFYHNPGDFVLLRMQVPYKRGKCSVSIDLSRLITLEPRKDEVILELRAPIGGKNNALHYRTLIVCKYLKVDGTVQSTRHPAEKLSGNPGGWLSCTTFSDAMEEFEDCVHRIIGKDAQALIGFFS